MEKRRNSAAAISLASMMLLLVLAYALDSWIELLKQSLSQSFIILIFWIPPLVNLVWAACLLLFSGLVNFRVERSKPVAVVFLVVGLALAAYPTIMFFLPTLPFPELLGTISFNSRLVYSGAFIAATGVLGLALPDK
jgi:hypothetical protein